MSAVILRPGLALWLIFGLALAVRLAVIGGTIGFHTPATGEPASDGHIYAALADSLLRGHGYSFQGVQTAFAPPLYIFFLATLYRLFGDPAAVRLMQAVLGTLVCLLMYAVGRRLFDHATGVLSAALLSVYPLVVYLAGLHLNETLFLFLLLMATLLALHVAERPTVPMVMAFGGLVGLAVLTRAVFLAFVPFLLAWTISIWGFRSLVTYRTFGLIAISAMAVVIPWTARNYVVLGTMIPVQSNSGLMFWAGNNAHADGGLVWPARNTWDDGPAPDSGEFGWRWRGVSIAAANQRYMRAAVAWIRQHPRDYAHLLVRKLVRLYGFTRAADGEDVHVPRAVVWFQAALLTSAAAGLLLAIRLWRRLFLFLLLVFFTNLVTLLFSGGTRYTIPMVPSLVLFSAVAVAAASRHAARAFQWHQAAVSTS